MKLRDSGEHRLPFLCAPLLRKQVTVAQFLDVRASGETRKAVTVNLTCNFLSTAMGETVHAEGRIIRKGRSMFFSDVRVPRTNLLGEEGKAMEYLGFNLAQERLSIGVNGGFGSSARAAPEKGFTPRDSPPGHHPSTSRWV